jgi:hypothetical protein
MNRPAGTSSPSATGRTASVRKDPRTLALNALIVVLALLVLVMLAAFVIRTFIRPPVEAERAGGGAARTIQIDVLNGCGASGAATSFTTYLRARGFDVVEVRNYRSFDVQESLVIDRAGDASNAERVAYALGVKKQNIIRQINQDYFVDVSVVIGRDYTSLKPSQ